MSKPAIHAIVFDVDGVLFDTERISQQSWISVSAGMGWPQVGQRYLEFIGQNRADILRKMLEDFGPEFPREEFLTTVHGNFTQRLETDGVPLMPGVREILDYLKGRNIPTAVATSTSRERTMHRMEAVGLAGYFRSITTGDQVTHSKPHPEIYQMACRSLGLPPEEVIAVEDSRNGILSAHAAGMLPVMIPDLIQPTPELDSMLFRRCESLMDFQQLLETLI